MPEMVKAVLPLFVIVTVFAVLVVPTCWEGNVKLVGLSVTTVPVPVRGTV
jgi:hypothetical protein